MGKDVGSANAFVMRYDITDFRPIRPGKKTGSGKGGLLPTARLPFQIWRRNV